MGAKAEALRLLSELQADLVAHKNWEGETVEFRNRNGSWEDVADRLNAIEEVLD